MKKIVITILLGLLGFTKAAEWYETASFYQIYPQSFFDDRKGSKPGTGTLTGIQSKLDYLKDLGIDCIWLTPVFKSSFQAFGYDITDYQDIDPRYGKLDDFKALVKSVHDKGMKIIVDFVPNHCGSAHEFFQKSIKNEEDYDDWFVWTKTLKSGDESNEPSNWQRIGGGPGTAWNVEAEKKFIGGVNVNANTETAFYYAQFSRNMPDFNFRNDKVKEYMKNQVMKFWLDIGVDGFRIDAISHVFESEKVSGAYPNENVNADVTDEEDYGYLNHTYTQNQPELFDLIYDWRNFMDTNYKTDKRIMMTESYSPPDVIMKMYQNADGTKQGAHLPFNFIMIDDISKDSKAKDFVDAISNWYAKIPTGKVTNWVMGNHDHSRVATRFGPERVDLLNTLITMLKGSSVTYYGEEIGMTDRCAIYDEDHEKPAKGCDETDKSIKITDAWFRSPMQWNDEDNAGFSNHTETWIPVASNYKTINVDAQEGEEKSHLEIYRKLMKMRKHKALLESDKFEIKTLGTNSFAFVREFSDVKEQSVIVVINFGATSEKVKVKEAFTGMPDLMTVEVVSGNSGYKIGDQISINGEIEVKAYESIVAVFNSSMTHLISFQLLLIVTVFIRIFFI